MILARVTFGPGGGREAVLGADRLWRVADDPLLTDLLNAGGSGAENDGPADGAVGYRAAHRVAGQLGGTAHFPDRPPGPPDRVY